MIAEKPKIEMITKYVNGAMRFSESVTQLIKRDWCNDDIKDILKGANNPQEARDRSGASLLHVAADYGNKSITKFLVSLGFDVNLQDEHGRTPLTMALKNQHFKVAEILMESGADIWLDNALQNVINVDAILISSNDLFSHGKLSRLFYWQIVATMLDKVNDDYESDSEKIADLLLKFHCPLTHLVFIKNSEVLKIMIEKGSSINVRTRFTGETALHLAVSFWKLDKVKLLLDLGADINALDDCTNTPLMCIYHMRHFINPLPTCEVELLTVLLERKAQMITTGDHEFTRQVQDIFRLGSKDAVQLLMENDQDLLLAKYKGSSMFHELATNANPEIRKVIEGIKIDVDAKDSRGNTALAKAVDVGNYKMTEYLLDKGARLDVKDDRGMSPMHLPFHFPNVCSCTLEKIATIEERVKCIKLLLIHGGDPEIMFEDEHNVGESNDTWLKNAEELEHLRPLVEPVLAQLAIRKVLKLRIPEDIQQEIKTHEFSKKYFYRRVNELDELETSVIWKSVTVFDLLIASNKKISFYARSKILISKLSGFMDDLEIDCYYNDLLRKRLSKIYELDASRKKAAEVFSENIGRLYEFNTLVTDIIIDYLSDDDVQKLICKL